MAQCTRTYSEYTVTVVWQCGSESQKNDSDFFQSPNGRTPHSAFADPSEIEMGRAANRPANKPLIGLVIGPPMDRFYLCLLLGR